MILSSKQQLQLFLNSLLIHFFLFSKFCVAIQIFLFSTEKKMISQKFFSLLQHVSFQVSSKYFPLKCYHKKCPQYETPTSTYYTTCCWLVWKILNLWNVTLMLFHIDNDPKENIKTNDHYVSGEWAGNGLIKPIRSIFLAS